MAEKIILKGVFTEFGKKDILKKKKLGKKINGRKAIPNYYRIDKHIKAELGDKFTSVEYNTLYIKKLKEVLYTCKEFECGNISDSSSILLISVNEDFNEYTLKGLFDINKKTRYK